MPEKKEYKEFYTPGAIIIGAFIIAGAILYAANPALFQSLVVKQAGVTQPSAQTQPSRSAQVSIAVSTTDHIRGNTSAPVTIVEFSDLQCPFCQKFHPELKQALQEYGNNVRWVFKQFPLYQIHPQAEPAAEASECVYEQKGNDGFWQFADGVFANQDTIGSALFSQLAQKIGVNMSQYNSCVSSQKYKAKIQADIDLGTKLGVQGTPTTFINGVLFGVYANGSWQSAGAAPYSDVKTAIDAQLRAK